MTRTLMAVALVLCSATAFAESREVNVVNLWQQRSLLIGAPERVDGMVGVLGDRLVPDDQHTLAFDIKITGVATETGTLDVSGADFVAVESGNMIPCLAVKLDGMVSWVVSTPTLTARVGRDLKVGDSFEISVAFCCNDEKYDWHRARLYMAVPLEIASASAVKIETDGDSIEPWRQQLSLVVRPLVLDVILTVDGRTLKPSDTSDMLFTSRLDLAMCQTGRDMAMSKVGVIAVDPTGRRACPVAMRDASADKWSTGSPITLDASGGRASVELAFCVSRVFGWEGSTLRVVMPMDRVSPLDR